MSSRNLCTRFSRSHSISSYKKCVRKTDSLFRFVLCTALSFKKFGGTGKQRHVQPPKIKTPKGFGPIYLPRHTLINGVWVAPMPNQQAKRKQSDTTVGFLRLLSNSNQWITYKCHAVNDRLTLEAETVRACQ